MYQFQVRFDPTSGKWQFLYEAHGKRYWSRPMRARELEEVAKALQDDYPSEPGKTVHVAKADAQAILALGVLGLGPLPYPKIHKCPPQSSGHPTARESSLRGLTTEEIFNKLGLGQLNLK